MVSRMMLLAVPIVEINATLICPICLLVHWPIADTKILDK